jgi:hypothetical protein
MGSGDDKIAALKKKEDASAAKTAAYRASIGLKATAAGETPAEYAARAGIPAADLITAGMPASVVQEVATIQKTAASTAAPAASSTSAAATSSGSAGKEYVFQFSGPLKGSIATYVSKLVKVLGGKRAYIEDQTKLVVVM